MLKIGVTVIGIALSMAQAVDARDGLLPNLLRPSTDENDDWRNRVFLTGQPLTFYGQIGQAFLRYNDGDVARSYAPVDNSNASTRIGFLYDFRSIGQISAVGRFEAGITPRPSSGVNLKFPDGNDFAFDGSNLRKLEVILDLPKLGVLSLGQGSMATDGIAEIDLSGTSVTAFSDVAKPAGGQFLRRADGLLSAFRIEDVFNNFDGDNVTGRSDDGSRKLRVRFDARSVHGFKASVAAGLDALEGGGDTFVDAALRYERELETLRIGAGVGYSKKGSDRITAGSVSVVHKSSGTNLTFAAGHSDVSGRYEYIKLGVKRSLFDFGDTSISLDFYRGIDLIQSGSTSRSYGIAVAQDLQATNVQFFALLRRYKVNDGRVAFQPSTAFFSGLQWSF